MHLCLGRALGSAGRHPEAISALRVAEKLSTTPFEHIIALTLLGNEYKSAKDYSAAMLAYQQSATIARTDKNKRYEMVNLNLMGERLQASGEVRNAISSYESAYKLAANDNERADSHSHMAAAYSEMGEHDQAIIHQIKTVVLEERSGDLDHYAHANLELGRMYIDAKQPGEAEKLLDRMLPIVIQAGDAYWEASVYAMQARAKYSLGQAEQGALLFDRGIALARKIGVEELAREIEESRSRIRM